MKICTASLLLLSFALPVSALAQGKVVKCVDPRTGAVSYSNMACPAGDGGKALAREKTAVEREAERRQAEQALRERNARQQRERFEADLRATQERQDSGKP